MEYLGMVKVKDIKIDTSAVKLRGEITSLGRFKFMDLWIIPLQENVTPFMVYNGDDFIRPSKPITSTGTIADVYKTINDGRNPTLGTIFTGLASDTVNSQSMCSIHAGVSFNFGDNIGYGLTGDKELINYMDYGPGGTLGIMVRPNGLEGDTDIYNRLKLGTAIRAKMMF